MTAPLTQAPAVKAGAAPRKGFGAQDLHSLGDFAPTPMRKLDSGDVIALGRTAVCVVRRNVNARWGTGLIVRALGTTALRSITANSDSRVSILRMREEVPGGWPIRQGDVVLFPGKDLRRPMAAIRHEQDWHPTEPPWTPLCDAEVVLSVVQGEATVLRSLRHRHGVPYTHSFVTGSVAAPRNIRTKEPTVWLRTEPDYWTSSARGAAISDEMMKHQLTKASYHLVWVPGRRSA